MPAAAHDAENRGHFGQTEVANLGVPALGDKNVGRLDVTVNDTLCVHCVERIGNLNSQREHRVQFHWTVADQMLQGRTVQELHYDEGFLTVLADLVDRAVNRLIVGENLSSSIARILRAMIFFFPFRSV
jgi:hypothetical protein